MALPADAQANITAGCVILFGFIQACQFLAQVCESALVREFFDTLKTYCKWQAP